MEKKYLLFDYGASHGRCIVGKFDGEKIDMEVICDFDNRPVNFAGTLYWDILRLASEIKIGMRKAFAMYPDISSIGIDTWGCDFGFIDADGKLLGNPANYRDSLRYEYKKKLDEEFGELELYKEAGANTSNIMGIYHMYGLVKTGAEQLKVADKMLMIPDLLNYYLTGIPANEYTVATMFLGVNQQEGKWSEKLIDFCGFDKKWFSPLSQPGTVLGDMKPELVEEFGVPNIPVISVAGHDSASAVAGMPIENADKEWCYLSWGTWSLLGVESADFFNKDEVMPTGFATQGGCEGKNNFTNLITGMWVIQQCMEKWKRDNPDVSWDDVVKAATVAQRGKAFFSHEDQTFAFPSPDMPGLIQDYCRKTGQGVPEGMGEVAACVYENQVLILKEAYENLKRFTGKEFEVIQVVGGGSKNALLCQWLADALQLTVKAGPSETTSVGNLLLQMKAMGDITDLTEGRKIAARSFDTKTYVPGDGTLWEERYAAYRAHCGR